MTINSWGYEGSIAPNTVWARMQWALGHEYFVADEASVRVTPALDGTREVDIAPGFFGGQGILDENDASYRLQLPTVATGTTYFLVVARRTWGATQATTFDFVDAGNGAALPTRETNPGVLDDQPLALVPVVAGQTIPGAPIDLRAIGHGKGGPYSAFSDLVLSYLNRVGTVVKIGSATWTRVVSGSYAAAWEKAGSDTVGLSGDQAIDGIKTFMKAPVVPAAAFPLSAVENLQSELGKRVTTAPAPIASRYKTNDSSIPNDSWTNVSLNAQAFTPVGITWQDPNFVVPTTGRYIIAAGVRFDSNGNGNRGIGLVRNDGTILNRTVHPTEAGACTLTVTKVMTLAAGQAVRLQAYQSSGGSLKVEGTAGSAVERSVFLDITYLGA